MYVLRIYCTYTYVTKQLSLCSGLVLCVDVSCTRVGLSGHKALSSVNYIGVGLVIWADLMNVGNGFRTDDSVYQAKTG